MKPFSEFPISDLKKIKALFFDIDDTFSTDGKIKAEAYSSLWKLYEVGIRCVPVTGRPAGWCDHIARFWPVHAVVGENGAFVLAMDSEKHLLRFDTPFEFTRSEARSKLENLKQGLLSDFEEIQFASDQNYREFDLAIDYCEDVKPWGDTKIKEVIDYCKSRSATIKLSSIHINTWFGSYTKSDGIQNLLSQNSSILGEQLSLNDCIYVGDSPNDAPLFEVFNHSVAVSNFMKFSAQSEFQPKWILSSESGNGFCELADRLLTSRKP
jgi:hypothetical protein